jgi:hypothetical protein
MLQIVPFALPPLATISRLLIGRYLKGRKVLQNMPPQFLSSNHHFITCGCFLLIIDKAFRQLVPI